MDLTAFIAENLFSCHAFLAGLSGNDLWAIEQGEADKLGEAIQGVARHYQIPGVNQKVVDFVRLGRTLGMVYGTRIFAARAMRKAASPAPAKPTSEPAPKPTVNMQSAAPTNNGPRTVMASPGPGLPDVMVTLPN